MKKTCVVKNTTGTKSIDLHTPEQGEPIVQENGKLRIFGTDNGYLNQKEPMWFDFNLRNVSYCKVVSEELIPLEKSSSKPLPGELTAYQIWSEGYSATGEHDTARLMGSSTGNSFREACISFFDKRKDSGYFNSISLTYWGCHLFDNESDARKSFG